MFRAKKFLVSALLAVTLIPLTGCVPEPLDSKDGSESSPSPSVSPSDSKSESSAKSSSPGQPQSEALDTEPISVDCATVFPVERLYEFDENLAVVTSAGSIASSVTQQQSQLGALYCDLVHLSSGEVVQFGFVNLTAPSAKILANRIQSLPTANAYQVTNSVRGNFEAPTGQFIDGQYWVSVSSTVFASPLDASSWSNLATQGLPR